MKEEQIVKSARILFNKYGYKRVSMDEIAKVAKVTKKTVYSYFNSKEELLKYFIKEEVLNMKAIVEEIEKENIPFFEKIHKGIINLLKYKNTKNFLQIIADEYDTFKNPVVLDNLRLIDKMVQNYILEKLKYADEQGFINVNDIEVTAFLIYKMYIALIFEWENNEINDSKLADNIISILKNGIERKDKSE